MIKKEKKIIISVVLLLFFGLSLTWVLWKPSGSVAMSDRPAIDESGYLAENIVRDSSTGKYWWVFSDRNVMGIRMASSPDLMHWEVENNLLIEDSPVDSVCIRRFGGIYYLFYSKCFGEGNRRGNLWMCSSSKVNGNFSSSQLVLDVGKLGDWDDNRVSEPDLVWKDGRYYLFFMGEDSKDYEKIGYAVSVSPSGPFVKYINNPVLSGSDLYRLKWNSGHDRAADPDIFQIEEGYIIQHTACKTSKENWSIGWAFTKDFITFKVMEDPILTASSWAGGAVSRGGLIQVKDKYYMSFAGYDSATMKYGKCGLVEIKNFEELKNKLLLSDR